MISILIITKNEEQDLPGCLQSVAWSDDVHVFDSESTDSTKAIALRHGAHFSVRRFDGYASQKNAALHGISFKYDWVFLLDADERIPDGLRLEMANFVGSVRASVAAGRVRRRDYFMGTWLKHAQISPFYIRLVRPCKVRFEREINEVLIPDGEVLDLNSHFDHFPFSKGISHWVQKHDRYSTMEAVRALEERRLRGEFSLIKALIARDFHIRRYHQKGLFYRMPCRPLVKWCYMMFVRGAILDGRAGWTYARLQAIYEFLIVTKQSELVRSQIKL